MLLKQVVHRRELHPNRCQSLLMNYLTPESSNEPEEYVPNEADIENIIVQNVIEEAIDFDFNQGVISSQVLQGVLSPRIVSTNFVSPGNRIIAKIVLNWSFLMSCSYFQIPLFYIISKLSPCKNLVFSSKIEYLNAIGKKGKKFYTRILKIIQYWLGIVLIKSNCTKRGFRPVYPKSYSN